MRFRNQTEQEKLDEITREVMEELRKSREKALFFKRNYTSTTSRPKHNIPYDFSGFPQFEKFPDPLPPPPSFNFSYSDIFFDRKKLDDLYKPIPTLRSYESFNREEYRYNYNSHKIVILGVILLLAFICNVIKAFVSSRRKAPPSRSILIIGPIPEFNRSSAPSSHPNYRPLSVTTTEECRINCNPLYDDGRVATGLRVEGQVEQGQTQNQGNNPLSTASSSSSSDSLNQHVMDAVIGAFIEAIMEECHGHSNPVYEDGRGGQTENYTDRPPSYSELDTVIDIQDTEAPPPSYNEVANNSDTNIKGTKPQEPNITV